jgi:O-acetyl-ADP-ribose deacetylase (regulator of RNase III)
MIINQDLLEVPIGIIAHQCNSKGVMGAGLASQIKKKWYNVYSEYRSAYEITGLPLGSVLLVRANDNVYVANIIAQESYGRDRSTVYTDYEALKQGLVICNKYSELLGIPLYVPYRIGCGLAGGDWELVIKIIRSVAPNAVICKLDS